MQLRVARMCLDCEEVHDLEQCPLCASEAFVYLSRWVPAPERRTRPRPPASPEVEIYRQLTQGHDRSRWPRLIGQSALGLTIAGVMGWVVRGFAESKASRDRGKAA